MCIFSLKKKVHISKSKKRAIFQNLHKKPINKTQLLTIKTLNPLETAIFVSLELRRQTLHSTPMNPKLFFSETLIRNASRSYYTNTAHKASLYYKISPLGDPATSVVPELDAWVERGKKVRVGELQRIIHDLRKRKRFSQALEVTTHSVPFFFF